MAVSNPLNVCFACKRGRGHIPNPSHSFWLSIKDEPPLSPSDAYDPQHGWPKKDRQSIYGWMAKFEKVLRNLYWYGANVHVSADFEPDRVFYYTPTEAAVDKMVAADPQTINEWELKIINIAALST